MYRIISAVLITILLLGFTPATAQDCEIPQNPGEFIECEPPILQDERGTTTTIIVIQRLSPTVNLQSAQFAFTSIAVDSSLAGITLPNSFDELSSKVETLKQAVFDLNGVTKTQAKQIGAAKTADTQLKMLEHVLSENFNKQAAPLSTEDQVAEVKDQFIEALIAFDNFVQPDPVTGEYGFITQLIDIGEIALAQRIASTLNQVHASLSVYIIVTGNDPRNPASVDDWAAFE